MAQQCICPQPCPSPGRMPGPGARPPLSLVWAWGKWPFVALGLSFGVPTPRSPGACPGANGGVAQRLPHVLSPSPNDTPLPDPSTMPSESPVTSKPPSHLQQLSGGFLSDVRFCTVLAGFFFGSPRGQPWRVGLPSLLLVTTSHSCYGALNLMGTTPFRRVAVIYPLLCHFPSFLHPNNCHHPERRQPWCPKHTPITPPRTDVPLRPRLRAPGSWQYGGTGPGREGTELVSGCLGAPSPVKCPPRAHGLLGAPKL